MLARQPVRNTTANPDPFLFDMIYREKPENRIIRLDQGLKAVGLDYITGLATTGKLPMPRQKAGGISSSAAFFLRYPKELVVYHRYCFNGSDSRHVAFMPKNNVIETGLAFEILLARTSKWANEGYPPDIRRLLPWVK